MKDTHTYVLIPIAIVLACFIIWTPSQLMITDELSYYFQAKHWLKGNPGNTIIDAVTGTTHTLIEGHYPPGTSFLIAGYMSLYEPSIYFIGFIYLLVSIFLCHRTLKISGLPSISISVLFLFLPIIFISRTTMSEMPSLLLVTIGVFLYYKNGSKSYLWLAFITGLSLAFRETNLLLLAPMAFLISRNYIFSTLAFISGFSFRLIGYYILVSNPFFVKEGYPFGVEFIPDTFFIYAIILLVLLPLSPFWFLKVPRDKLKAFGFALLTFLGLHLVYGYVAHVYSGYTNGILLNGRFWIPTLPLFIMSIGYFLKDKTWIKSKLLSILVITLIALSNITIHYKSSLKQKEYKAFTEAIKNGTTSQLTFIDMNNRTPIYRYIYSFVDDRNWSDINLINNNYHISQTFNKYDTFRVAIISSGATVAQSNRNKQFYEIINKLKEKYSVNNITELCPGGNSCLNIYEVKRKTNIN